jgi:hypothetical protein
MSRRWTTTTRIGAVMVLALAGLLGSGMAFAQSDADRAMARTMGNEATTALAAKDYATAADRFARADALFPAPTLKLGLARAQTGLGKLVAAEETYNRLLRAGAPPGASAPFLKALDEAKSELGALIPRVAHVTITVKGPASPRLTLDGAPLSSAALGSERPVDPGPHALHTEGDGFKPGDTQFMVPEGGAQSITVELTPLPPGALPIYAPGTQPLAPPGTQPPGAQPVPLYPYAYAAAPQPPAQPFKPPPPKPKRILKVPGILALSVGGAGIVVGLAGGLVAMGAHAQLELNCPGNQCTADQQSNLNTFHTAATVSNVGFIAGGIVALAGMGMLIFSPTSVPKEATSSRLGPYLTPGGAGIEGAF